MQALRFIGKGDGLTGRLEREQQGLVPHSATRVSVEKEPLANGYVEMGKGSDGALVWLEKERDGTILVDGFALTSILMCFALLLLSSLNT
jgi:hypothetical protein